MKRKVRNAKKELINIFKNKYEHYEEQQIDLYETIKSKTESIPLEKAINDLEERLKKLTSQKLQDATDEEVELYELELSSLHHDLEIYQEKYKKSKNLIVWKITNLTNSKSSKIFDSVRNLLKTVGNMAYYPESKNINALQQFEVYKNGDMSLEKFLEHKGVFKPVKRTDEEVRLMCNRFLFYINTHENSKFMRQVFSWALSNEKDSMSWFKLFMDNVKFQTGKLFKEGINIEKPARNENLLERYPNEIHSDEGLSDEIELAQIIKRIVKK